MKERGEKAKQRKNVSRPAGSRWRRFQLRSRSPATTCHHQLRHFDERYVCPQAGQEKQHESEGGGESAQRPVAVASTLAGENASVAARPAPCPAIPVASRRLDGH